MPHVLETERARRACALLRELRVEMGLDPRIPDLWMTWLEWWLRHSVYGPRVLAAVVVATWMRAL